MKVSQDTKEMLISYGSSFLEAYKVCMACLLSLFVPQYCTRTNEPGGTCSLKENLQDLNGFNTFVVVLNFVTLGAFIYLYSLQNRRETYLITHLDSSQDVAVTALKDSCKDHPNIFTRVIEHNSTLMKLVKIVSVMFTCNAVCSAVLVIEMFYDGARTVTTLISSVLLVSAKLVSMYTVCDSCLDKDTPLALSTFRSTPVGYNVIDEDYKKQPTA
jgi:hypothetical protein